MKHLLSAAFTQVVRQAWKPGLLAACMLPAAAQDAARIQPGTYKVAMENARVRVLEYTSRPGMGVCGQGLHSHPAHLTILLTPAKVRVTKGGKTVEAEQQQGTVFWSEAETHEVENVSGRNTRLLIVELKGPGGPADAAAAITR